MQKNIKKTKNIGGKDNIYNNIKISKIDGGKVEITGSISVEEFTKFRSEAIQNINEEVKIDGFRSGKIPEAILISKIGEMPILEEMAELALSVAYPQIVVTEKVDAIGRPEINITKLATDNPLEFKIITSVMPEVKVGDYKKISSEIYSKKDEIFEVTNKEVDDAIIRIRKSRADHSGHNHDSMTPEEHEKAVEASMPELTDDFARSLGAFKDVEELKSKIKSSLLEDKKYQANEKKRIELSDKLIETSEIDVPQILIDSELKRIEMQFSDDISRMGVKIEDYLKHAKKTIEEIRVEWTPHAVKKAKLQLILNKIGSEEKISATPEEVEAEVKHILEHYKDADHDNAYTYAETVLTNEKIYSFLEQNGQAKK